MFPYLDLLGFEQRTIMPASDVALVEASSPGFTATKIADRSSFVNARLRKRYGNAPTVGNSLPLGQKAPILEAAGTDPPAVLLQGRPVVGCFRVALAILIAGALGTATFQWTARWNDGGPVAWTIGSAALATGTAPPAVTLSGASSLALPSDLVLEVVAAGVLGGAAFQYSADGGATFTIAPFLAAAGTSPPPVAVSGLSSLDVPSDLVIDVTTAGGLGVAVVRYSLDGGSTFVTGVPTAAAVELGASGLVASFPPGLYATDNVYTGRGLPTSAQAPLGATGLTATFAAGTYATDNVYTGQGIPTAALVQLGTTGMQAVFPAGSYASDNVYQSSTPVPAAVLGWIVALVTVDLYQKRGVNAADPMIAETIKERDQALADLKEAADSREALFDLPACEDGDSAVTTGGPEAYTETSPYAWTDVEAQRGRTEDGQGRGTSS